MSLKTELRSLSGTGEDMQKFSRGMGGALLLLGTASYLFGGNATALLYMAGGLILLLGICVPSVLKPFHWAWMGLAVVLGLIMTRIILIIIFYFILLPISLIARAGGKRFLQENIQKDHKSYWNMRQKIVYSKISYEQQF